MKILKILVSLIFISAGIAALCGAERFVGEFTRWGYSLDVLALFASLEIICGVLMLIPRVQKAGSAGLLLIVVWGLVHHICYGDALSVMVPGIVLTLLLGFILWKQVREVSN